MDIPVWFPSGPETVPFKFAYTAEGPHHLELVRAVPNTLWTVSGIGHAHHLGYWCDDVPGASAALAERGVPLCAKVGVDTEDAEAPIVLHKAKTGVYIELVTSANRAMMFGDRS